MSKRIWMNQFVFNTWEEIIMSLNLKNKISWFGALSVGLWGLSFEKSPLWDIWNLDLLKDNPRLKRSLSIQFTFCCCAFMACYLADRRPHNISWDWRDKVGKDQHFFMGKERSCFSSKWQELRIEALLWLLFSIAIIPQPLLWYTMQLGNLTTQSPATHTSGLLRALDWTFISATT